MSRKTRAVLIQDVEGDDTKRVIVTTDDDDRKHIVEGYLTNELVIHPDGGIYLRLMLRPRRVA